MGIRRCLIVNYTVEDKNYVANEGYVFISKATGIISKKLRLRDAALLDNYDVIEEPVVEEPVEPEVEVDENAATEADYINALEELGVNFNE